MRSFVSSKIRNIIYNHMKGKYAIFKEPSYNHMTNQYESLQAIIKCKNNPQPTFRKRKKHKMMDSIKRAVS